MKPQTPPKPATLQRINSLLSSLGTQQRKVLLAGLLVFFLLLGFTTLLLAYYIYEPEITSLLQRPTSIFNPTSISQSVLPTQMNIPTPTPSCLGASLQLGTSSWRLESLQRLADGSVTVPADTPGVAYKIKDLEMNYVFALSPTQDNFALINALQGGEEAVITWENCNTETYLLSALQPGEPGTEILTSEPASQLLVYIQGNASASGVMVQGELVGETITSPPTYAPAPSEVNAEISLLETSPSPDGANLQVVVSIMNFGSGLITLSQSDITLISEGAAPLGLAQSDPLLPQEIKPGESKTFTLFFPPPTTDTAVLKIFSVEYDLNNY